ncbi:LysR family transcriptional regulator [Aquincola tertiaricarbonis]|uniref:LysR family transcriptional regulator n=1 Tax=Aquincola tertiaricarbonis TaxID=391953 RepID=A0ABY4S1A5_AQUTE|nr:LysR family transcriptional regulator [Aquincola tertiaricarbonis]URI07193.1 LysR family transcriptional regulator [Aquincola tertiaricarbonis]
MSRLNFHHLHYFWAVAKEGHLTRAAAQLHVSQSVLSTQIKRLEDQLGHALFQRVGRRLQLTEAGRMTLTYAESIFTSGNELLAMLRDGRSQALQVLRIGSVATLSRNFQENFVRPLLERSDVSLVLQSGSLEELLQRLRVHTLDLVLSNRRVHADADHPWRCRLLARQPVSLVGRPRGRRRAFRFPQDLAEVPLLLPGRSSDIRAGFDLLCEQHGLRCQVLAEVDDMAMLRLLARDTGAGAVALLPSVVVRDELASGQLVEYCVVPDLIETFYAITIQRHFEPPLLTALLRRDATDVLGS